MKSVKIAAALKFCQCMADSCLAIVSFSLVGTGNKLAETSYDISEIILRTRVCMQKWAGTITPYSR